MSWNGSQNAGQPANGRGERPARPPQKKSLFRSTTTTPNYNSSPHRSTTTTSNYNFSPLNYKLAALVALALAALAAALYFLLAPGTQPSAPSTLPAPSTRHKAQGTIAETPHAKARPARQSAAPTNAVVRTKNVRPPEVLTNIYYYATSSGEPLCDVPVFTNSAENIIAGLLAAKPGSRFMDPNLGSDFDDDFIASTKAEICVVESDTADTIAIKEAVAKAKDQIMDGIERGQLPSEIVMSLRDEMNRIADYRDNLQEEFAKVKEKESAEDIEQFLKEANALLDEYGADPLELPEDEVEEINARLAEEGGSEIVNQQEKEKTE